MPLTVEVQASTIIGVPPYAAAGAFTDVMAIKEYGLSRVIACCILETASDSSTIGTIRRVTFELSGFEGSVLRERLALVETSPQRTRVRMEYVPFPPEEAHRAPFGAAGTACLRRADTLITVTAVTSDPNRCFVELSTALEVDMTAPSGARTSSEEDVYGRLEGFWSRYLQGALSAVEDHLLSIAYPAIPRRGEAQMEREYAALEDAVCDWAARAAETMPRAEAVQLLEQAIGGWARARREALHQKVIIARLQNDLDGARAVATTAAAALAAASSGHATDETSTAPTAVPQPREESDPQQLQPLQTPQQPQQPQQPHAREASQAEVRVPFFSPGGGRRLSVSSARSATPPMCWSPTPQVDAPPHRPAPQRVEAELLRDVISRERGTVNEAAASALFRVLDEREEGFLGAAQVAHVLRQIDPLGLYEDRDGTMQQVAECRAAVGTGIFRNDGRSHGAAQGGGGGTATHTFEAVAKVEEAPPLTALQALVRRHDALKRTMREEVLQKRSEELVGSFAYRTQGKIHYDEFCLMMLHLLRDY